MYKTYNEILTVLYNAVKASSIPAAISGDVHKRIRPTESSLEDCIVKGIPGGAMKHHQDGQISVLIYYPALEQDNTYYEDTARGQALERLLFDLSETLLSDSEIPFRTAGRELGTNPVTTTNSQGAITEYYSILKLIYNNSY